MTYRGNGGAQASLARSLTMVAPIGWKGTRNSNSISQERNKQMMSNVRFSLFLQQSLTDSSLVDSNSK
jgi:hypothetical protein